MNSALCNAHYNSVVSFRLPNNRIARASGDPPDARRAGELAEGEPLRLTLLDFADLVSGRCARIGDLHGDWDRNAGDHIRAVLHGIPGLLPMQPNTDSEPV